jgi:hypothetical protein
MGQLSAIDASHRGSPPAEIIARTFVDHQSSNQLSCADRRETEWGNFQLPMQAVLDFNHMDDTTLSLQITLVNRREDA